ncbi:glucuronate isomerase [Paenibacillus sp. J31TS4]|uniref:glucuronate isomerase n=1 Tax=Paenibacillus sp. J31TS4 TaxID=2807195 RepID=UPI001B10BFE9|nr:glucuronate isomerase [Paenibacillus sp. J31TS4]GIP37574.1 glucuronate isomerase [Paenibacillus sp. J31TS4]
MTILSEDQLRQVIEDAVQRQPVTDMHTHLYSPNFGDILLWGVDELLTYHYLVAEVMRWSDIQTADFWKLSKQEQAELIWQKLFLEHSPISEACRGVLTSLQGLGADLSTRDLASYREAIDQASDNAAQVRRVLELANVDHVVMTNDPFDDKERPIWLNGTKPDANFHAALRIDPLLNDYANSKHRLREWGYDVSDEWDDRSAAEVTRFLTDWIERMDPVYMAVSLPPTFAFPEESDRGRIIRDCILPVSRKTGIPFAMMIGVKKRVHPELRDAGDYLAKASMEPLEHLLSTYPDNKFIVTMLSRENQHELAVLGRKFRNLLIFGCWWFLNNPIIINEMTRMRFELLGLSVVPQHSDARVLDQLIYKWKHSKELIAGILFDKYADVLRTGWPLDAAEIRRDVADLFRNNFWRFVGRENMVRYDDEPAPSAAL